MCAYRINARWPLNCDVLNDPLDSRQFPGTVHRFFRHFSGNCIDILELPGDAPAVRFDSTDDAVVGLPGFDEKVLPLSALLGLSGANNALQEEEERY